MSNINDLKNFVNQPQFDLGENAWILADLVKSYKNSRFMDLGVRFGVSSSVLSIGSEDNNNKVYGCDITFSNFNSNFVSSNYVRCLADSVTLGKNWNEDPFDIIFVDTQHTREFVLSELYFWINHLKKDGYFIFHDTHLVNRGDYVFGEDPNKICWETPDKAVVDFFKIPQEYCNGEEHCAITIDNYEDDDIILNHCKESCGMTFVKIKNLNAISKFKSNIDWEDVFKKRNYLNDLALNKNRKDCIGHSWNLDFDNILNELVIVPE